MSETALTQRLQAVQQTVTRALGPHFQLTPPRRRHDQTGYDLSLPSIKGLVLSIIVQADRSRLVLRRYGDGKRDDKQVNWPWRTKNDSLVKDMIAAGAKLRAAKSPVLKGLAELLPRQTIPDFAGATFKAAKWLYAQAGSKATLQWPKNQVEPTMSFSLQPKQMRRLIQLLESSGAVKPTSNRNLAPLQRTYRIDKIMIALSPMLNTVRVSGDRK